jgi:hypothetical protein
LAIILKMPVEIAELSSSKNVNGLLIGTMIFPGIKILPLF